MFFIWSCWNNKHLFFMFHVFDDLKALPVKAFSYFFAVTVLIQV
jgi:hypothetical protein